MEKNLRRVRELLICVSILLVGGCGGGGSDPSVSASAASSSVSSSSSSSSQSSSSSSSSQSSSTSSSCTSCTVGGTVSGLGANESVTLLNNGGEPLTVASDGGFTFSSGRASGSTYDVTVKSQTPGIMCSVSNGSGTVGSSNVAGIAVSCAAGTETVLYSFGGAKTDGMWPLGSVAMDSAGNLYGTTSGTSLIGSTNTLGTVFKISVTGTETILHSFAGGTTDGAQPVAGLIIDSAGNLYGTTTSGGASGEGTVFKISVTGTETILHSFAGGTTDGAQPMTGLIMDSAGNLYGTTRSGGGSSDWGTVFKISSNGTESLLYAFTGGTADGELPGGELIVDSAGNLYGVTFEGGAYDAGTVFKINSNGTETILHSFAGGTTDGANPMGRLVMDSAGSLYGATEVGGANSDGTIFKIDPSGAETILYSFKGGPIDGAEPQTGLIMDGEGNLYGTTYSGGASYNSGLPAAYYGTVFKLGPTGTEVVLHSFPESPADGAVPNGGLIIDSAGNLYGTTMHDGANYDGTVFKIN